MNIWSLQIQCQTNISIWNYFPMQKLAFVGWQPKKSLPRFLAFHQRADSSHCPIPRCQTALGMSRSCQSVTFRTSSSHHSVHETGLHTHEMFQRHRPSQTKVLGVKGSILLKGMICCPNLGVYGTTTSTPPKGRDH